MNKKIIIIVVAAVIAIGAILTIQIKEGSFKVSSEIGQDFKDTITLDKVNEVVRAKNLKGEGNFSLLYDETLEILKEGTVSYPNKTDKSLKIEYWIYEDNGYKYFLDGTFYMDNLVNLESRFVDIPKSLDKAFIENYSEIKSQINSAKTLKELENIIGKGIKSIKYHNESDDTIYAWEYSGGFLTAYVINGDEVINIRTSESLDDILAPTASCH